MKIYTKTGDDGSTGLFGNKRVRKDDLRIEAYGSVDELNATIGVVLAYLPDAASSARPHLEGLQNDLFVVGAQLATPPESNAKTTLQAKRTTDLEAAIDQMEKTLTPLQHFILPQGTPCASFTHLARAVCRRAERHIISLHTLEPVDSVLLAYINRLSDYLFVLARWINRQEGGTETPWLSSGGAGAGPKPDILSASLHKLEEEKKRRQSLFEKTAGALQKKKSDAAKNFEKSVEQIKRDGGKVEPNVRPIDLD